MWGRNVCDLNTIFHVLRYFLIFPIQGRPPDFLAFLITILMMILLAAGVRKSLVFNNVLNTINLAAWVFIMAAGLFYVNTDSWNMHGGFLPKGWSGVSSCIADYDG